MEFSPETIRLFATLFQQASLSPMDENLEEQARITTQARRELAAAIDQINTRE